MRGDRRDKPKISTPRTAGKAKRLSRAFYLRPAAAVALDLIGAILVHRTADERRRARIVEAEAYIGVHDLAAHSSKGRTPRAEIMFGRGGFAYVYLIYGVHEMFNIVTGPAGDGQAVLIRAAEPLDGWTANLTGPGNFARQMAITRADYGRDLTGDTLYLERDATDRPSVLETKRIGVDYSGDWQHALLRFIDANSLAVSKPRLGPAATRSRSDGAR